jgi:cell wall-associated NlpC family hydrolase
MQSMQLKNIKLFILFLVLPLKGWCQSDFKVIFDDDPPAVVKNDTPKILVVADSLRTSLVSNAKKYLGVSYHYSQSNENGFDCSGYVKYVYGNFGYSLPRSSLDQYRQCRHVKEAKAQPGDLVFFVTRGRKVSHVGIYLGNNQFIHSPGKGKSVSISNLDEIYYKKHLAGFGTYLKTSDLRR